MKSTNAAKDATIAPRTSIRVRVRELFKPRAISATSTSSASALSIAGPPLTGASMLPREWTLRLVDLNLSVSLRLRRADAEGMLGARGSNSERTSHGRQVTEVQGTRQETEGRRN